MLVPNADSSMDRERLASADLAEGVRIAPSASTPVSCERPASTWASFLPLRHWSLQKRIPLPNMAEGASFAAYSCM